MTGLSRVLFGFAVVVTVGASQVLAQAPARGRVGHPLRGAAKWTALLCHYADETPSRPRDYYVEIVGGRPGAGLRAYLRDLSRGLFDYEVAVHGWVVIGKRLADRGQTTYADCLGAAAAAGVQVPSDHFTLVYTLTDTGARGFAGTGAHAPPPLDGVMHESLHAFGIDHAHSHYVFDYTAATVTPPPPMSCMDPPDPAKGWRPGLDCVEYGDAFDVMSYVANFWTNTSWGRAGPRMSAFHLDRMGWLGSDEVVTFGTRGETSATYTLSPLYAKGTGGVRAVRVPFDRGDAHHYYLIQLRQSTGWDNGFGAGRPWVLIQEVKRSIDGRLVAPSNASPQGYLLNDLQGTPVQAISANGIEIRVGHVAADGSSAEVTVSGGLGRECVVEWVGPSPTDFVCTARGVDWWDQSKERGCEAGRVWDESAGACVAIATVTPTDVVGPNACKGGYVWRQIDAFDFVCVTPQRKASVDWETANAPLSMPNKYLFVTCPSGYVERRAFPTDFACVPPQSRADAEADNLAAWSRLAYP